MRTFPGAWPVAGLVAGAVGLATSYFVAMVVTVRDWPVAAVAELVIRLTPGPAVEKAIALVGRNDKTILVVVILVLTGLLCAWAGVLAARAWWAPVPVFGLLAAVGLWGVLSQRGATAVDALPVLAGFVVWLVCLSLLTAPLARAADTGPAAVSPEATRASVVGSRRSFLLRASVLGAGAVALDWAGRALGSGRRHVEESRRLLRLPGVSAPVVPSRARVDLPGITSWITPADEFYKIDTSIVVPAIEPTDWKLRIHGMVDRELVLTYQDLLDRRLTEGWITLNCVSNPVGGPLIGNAWWSGVRLAGLLREAGVHPDADAVLQTSDDGWTCGTPLETLTDDRNAMLAVAMNGEPLPLDHGFPVRTIVPGLYGYVSACKWVVDMEVSTFARISAYWTDRGWSERGPVKLSSRIDVPGSGDDVTAGTVRVGGVAWAQHVGISRVEVALDGGDWQPAEISHPPTVDTWVQWVASLDVRPGDHVVRVRATDRNGLVQTGVERGVLPNGSTGWHSVDFTAAQA